MAEELKIATTKLENFHLQMPQLESIAVQLAGNKVINVQSVESEKICLCLSEPEPIHVTLVGSMLGHGIASPITDHGDVESANEQKNDVLLFNPDQKKYENKRLLSFDETTDEFIIGLN